LIKEIKLNKLPPLNSLRYFLVAAQTLSFKQTAEQLFVTQAAISQHMQAAISQHIKTLEVDDSTVTIVDAVLAGQGFSMLRYNLIYQQIQRRQLVSLFDFSHPSAYSYYLVAPSHHFSKLKVQLFEKWLIEALTDIH